MSVVIGIDLGTQSLKVLCYDANTKQVLASTSSPLEVRTDTDGTAEQEADWWLTALRDAFSGIPSAVKSRAVALSVSGQQHGFVPLDRDGQVLAPVKLWCDTSTKTECEEIMAAFGGEARCREILGNTIVTGYTASKILWFKKNKPDLYQKMATVLLPHDYLNFYLSGERKMEVGDASGTGFLNIFDR